MIALIALGSNLGTRERYLAEGLKSLRLLGPVLSSPLVMETLDESGQGPSYLNTVALLDSLIDDPPALLEELLRIELQQGRNRSEGRNTPRTLDLDFIASDCDPRDYIWDAPADLNILGPQLTLTLPHPRAQTRLFVMQPLAQLKAVDPRTKELKFLS